MSKKEVRSFRVDKDISENFKERCDTLKVSEAYVVQELMKDFIVRNITKESHEAAEIIIPKIKDIEE